MREYLLTERLFNMQLTNLGIMEDWQEKKINFQKC